MKFCLGIAFLVVCAAYCECTISGWTNPNITSATGTANFTSATVAESATGVLATVTATSTDSTVSNYTFDSQENAGQLAISNTGEISLACGKTLDFESKTTIDLEIVATDAAGGKGTATTTLILTDVNEPPEFDYVSKASIVASCVPAGTRVVTQATDPDGDTMTCAIHSGNSGNDFTMTASSGAVEVAAGKELTANSYTLVVTCKDDASTPLTATSTTILCLGSESNCPSTSGTAVISGSLAAMFIVILSTFSNIN